MFCRKQNGYMRTEASVSSRLLAIAREASAELSDVASEPERERPMGVCILLLLKALKNTPYKRCAF